MVDKATKAMRKRIAKSASIFALVVALIAGGILWWFFSAHISFIVVRGESMSPTFENGETVVLEQAKEVEKGMIVVFPKPQQWDYMGADTPELIKRIAAGGGSTVEYDGEKLYIDGEVAYDIEANEYQCALEEGYSHTLSSEELFVMGDNHKNSLDSLRILCDNERPDAAYVPFLKTFAYGYVKGENR